MTLFGSQSWSYQPALTASQQVSGESPVLAASDEILARLEAAEAEIRALRTTEWDAYPRQ